MDKQGKVLTVILVLLGIVILGIGGVGAYIYTKFFRVPPPVAGQIMVTKAGVVVNGTAIEGEKDVAQGDTIETKTGEAIVTLYGSIKITLRPQTILVLADLNITHPRVEQRGGRTWSHVTRVGGVTGFTLQEGTNVVTVQGTAFEVSQGRVIVAEGEVMYESGGQRFSVTRGEVVEQVNGRPVERVANRSERQALVQQLGQNIEQLRAERAAEIARYQLVVNQLKSQFNITDEQIQQGLRDADEGRLNVDEIANQLPVRPAGIQRIIDLTKAIQRMYQDLQQLQQVQE